MDSGVAGNVVSDALIFLEKRTAGKPLIIAVSTGIDSAVVLMLCARMDRKSIHAYFMHDEATPESDFLDLAELEKSSGVSVEKFSIAEIEDSFQKTLNVKGDRKVLGNLKARIRMSILYYFANLYSGMVIGTTNRSEYLTGYFTKYGDGACDLEPILHLYKSEIKGIARYLGVPDSIIRKSPSAGLWPGQTDEAELGMTYDQLDIELRKAEEGSNRSEVSENVLGLIRESEHKRRLPPSLLEKW